MESILISTKRLLGISEEDTHFDQELIIHINSIFSTLRQLGVGPTEGFKIKNFEDTWASFIGDDRLDLEVVKSYMFLKVKLLFDPPQPGYLVNSLNDQCKEFEWRMNIEEGE